MRKFSFFLIHEAYPPQFVCERMPRRAIVRRAGHRGSDSAGKDANKKLIDGEIIKERSEGGAARGITSSGEN